MPIMRAQLVGQRSARLRLIFENRCSLRIAYAQASGMRRSIKHHIFAANDTEFWFEANCRMFLEPLTGDHRVERRRDVEFRSLVCLRQAEFQERFLSKPLW